MAKPSIFISSTYVDLAGVRDALSHSLSDMGYEPVLFEKGGVFFDPTRPLDESCYEEVKRCDIFVLIIGGRYGSPASRSKRECGPSYNSVTKAEYITARNRGIPIYTFVDEKVLHQLGTWRDNPTSRDTIKFAGVDNPAVFELVQSILELGKNNIVFKFSTVDDIMQNIKSQMAHLVQDAIHGRRRSRTPQPPKRAPGVRINPYKLFFFRTQQGMTIGDLAKKVKISKQVLGRLERVDKKGLLTISSFPKCDPEIVLRIEEALECERTLHAGRRDDFLSAYIQYYATYKGKAPSPGPTTMTRQIFSTKVAVFDFDGTLTLSESNETTWERIWQALGYEIDECAHYHRLYSEGSITHAKWCQITQEKFAAKGLTRPQLDALADGIRLVPGTKETLQILRDKGVRLVILSGSIKSIILRVLGDLRFLFDDVKANDILFNAAGELIAIEGTRFDFEGKATYLKRLISDIGISPLEVLFIGNSCNDVWASKSGARTLCVNPTFTDPNCVEHWTYSIRRMADLSAVLGFMFNDVAT